MGLVTPKSLSDCRIQRMSSTGSECYNEEMKLLSPISRGNVW